VRPQTREDERDKALLQELLSLDPATQGERLCQVIQIVADNLREHMAMEEHTW
jgi:hypothetical protein